jgi:hypothetical protein
MSPIGMLWRFELYESTVDGRSLRSKKAFGKIDYDYAVKAFARRNVDGKVYTDGPGEQANTRSGDSANTARL